MCEESEGTFLHMWWGCKKTKVYWEMIYSEFKKMLRLSFPPKTEIFLLSITEGEIPKKVLNPFHYATAVARIMYAQRWKDKNSPTKEDWQNKLIEYVELAMLTVKLRNQDESDTRE